MNDENEPGGFTIKDRRLFTEEGELKSGIRMREMGRSRNSQ